MTNTLRTVLLILPVLLTVCTIFGLIVAIRAVFIARREAYERAHQDFLELKDRVRTELRKDD